MKPTPTQIDAAIAKTPFIPNSINRAWMAEALSAALSVPAAAVVGEPVAWQPRYKQEVIDHLRTVSDNVSEFAMTVFQTKAQAEDYGHGGHEVRPLYAAPPAPDAMRDALSLVIEYDDLLRHWEGPEQVLLAGDVEEIDAAYDKMVAACRAALSDAPAGCKDEPVRPFGWIDLPVGAKGAIVSELKKARSSFTISDFEIAENIVSALAALGGASHD